MKQFPCYVNKQYKLGGIAATLVNLLMPISSIVRIIFRSQFGDSDRVECRSVKTVILSVKKKKKKTLSRGITDHLSPDANHRTAAILTRVRWKCPTGAQHRSPRGEQLP